MGKPEKLDEYVPIQIGEWARRYGTIYVPREMWGHLRLASWEFTFYAEDRGRFRLDFDLPIGRLVP